MFRHLVSKAAPKAMTSSTSMRAFHSPFAVLANASSPLTTPPSTPIKTDAASAAAYEKELESTPDPHVTPTGTRTYVVSTPDPADTPFEVPSGAYPNSSPYAHPPSGEKAPQNQMSSSTAAGPAHPATTRRVPHNESGIGESSAVRYRDAPGAMGERGGSNYGLDLMDKNSTKQGPDGELPDVNPPPLSKEAEKFSKLGIKDAWKERK